MFFFVDYYKHPGNKDNQTETAFNATIGIKNDYTVNMVAFLLKMGKIIIHCICDRFNHCWCHFGNKQQIIIRGKKSPDLGQKKT